MINGKLTEFIEQLYCGQELVFMYHNRKFFVQGWTELDNKTSTMVIEEIKECPFNGYFWEHESSKMSECAEAFLNSPIWEGKNFLQIENEVTWTDW